jgi:hypothetical protein
MFKQGDTKQSTVTDMGIGKVPAADLEHSSGTTATVDHALAKEKLDPLSKVQL